MLFASPKRTNAAASTSAAGDPTEYWPQLRRVKSARNTRPRANLLPLSIAATFLASLLLAHAALGARRESHDSSGITVSARVVGVHSSRRAAALLDSASSSLVGLVTSTSRSLPAVLESWRSEYAGERAIGSETLYYDIEMTDPNQPAIVQVEWTSN